ncbi:CaiB/BaiF CoA transferase family protein [Sphingomonas koreensis]|jgi:crotonobetainyl-CoA:carnitine CoA-transferase CaiB-like acyl-CoA transferase|uniref:CaiB/BaiF CoA transferase family protein n=1 Tax=Sphingomonas koreensis TaxID=93064 RepID=UPI000A4AA06C|nr:CaiB/BaiF CoA-transferase family protein [Sphingomonas koreensis]PJI89492.1 crotonobetainyl-CoA:carnitine CoA-transferase CaiB-like acyl-CoA transferase [Sphingomonas koreensis]
MTNMNKGAAPLAGRRVLDLSRVLAGPWCTMVLADLGAEVTKVEHPRGGDDTRHWGPPYTGGESAYYLCANRNKRSVALDISKPEGQRIVRDLAAQADVLVENYKLGGLEKFGLDYSSIAAINPRIVYCSISGYGRRSPIAERPGYDYVIQAEGGLMSVTGPVDGEPMKVGVAVADLFTGMAAAQAILAALIAADRDGAGQHLDMALYDCQLAMLANVGSAALVAGTEPRRYGNGHPTVVPYQLFDTLDGQVVVAVGNDAQFTAFATRLLDRPDLATDERFAKNGSRVANRDALLAEIMPLMRRHTTEWWLAGLRSVGVPTGAVRQVGEALAAPEATARDMVATVAHPSAGEVKLVASPLKLGRTPVVSPVAPPMLGQHSRTVLAELGYRADEIEALFETGVIA